jgi:hypothetical protein
VVAATLANLLASELSLKPLVKRVNEDLRRDDMRVGQELELRYFDILYRVLHYNRLKLADEYADHLQATAAGQTQPGGGAGAGAERLWEPNLKNVMDALDRMSFTRVVTAIERVGEYFHATAGSCSSLCSIVRHDSALSHHSFKRDALQWSVAYLCLLTMS